MNKNKNLAFTLAEVLIVIGIIGVVAALTLPNLNHATGDKETVTRFMKAYSILNEAHDRAVAIYGPVSTWNTVGCRNINDFRRCYMQRIGEFLKISKSCNEYGDEEESYSSCESLGKDYMWSSKNIYQLTDGMTFVTESQSVDCDANWRTPLLPGGVDACFDGLLVDVDGPNKGKNTAGSDVFEFLVSDKLGISPALDAPTVESCAENCIADKNDTCSWWVLEYGNLDYLKADSTGKCNDSNIILDGVTNTSCH